MATYSVYTGQNYESVGSTLLLLNSATQSYTFTENAVFTDIPDNTSKLVYPISVRNAVISLYDTIAFKENLIGDKYFIGIDNGNQNIKKPIYLGKRNYNNVGIANSNILTENDITIHNTKPDNVNNQFRTAMTFITGDSEMATAVTNTVEAQVVRFSNNTRRIDLSFLNSSGDINVLSKGPGSNDIGSYLSINGVTYTRLQDSDTSLGGSASEGRTLAYENGMMIWKDLLPNDSGWYGASYTTVPIFGSQTFVNGYPLDFTEKDMLPIEIGDLKFGETFDKRSISFMLNRIIYDYLSPTCTLSLVDESMAFAEIGTSPNVQLRYSVTKKSNDTKPTALTNMIPGQLPPITGLSRTVEGTAKGVVITPLERGTSVFKITASDGLRSNSASASLTGIYPFFFGFTASSTVNSDILKTMTKVVDGKGEQRIDIFRNGIESTDVFYFIYDYDYGPLNSVFDPGDAAVPTGYEILYSRFQFKEAILSSPSGLWAQKKFRVYYSTQIAPTYINSTTVGSFFRFIF
jgi:hypothetical protein